MRALSGSGLLAAVIAPILLFGGTAPWGAPVAASCAFASAALVAAWAWRARVPAPTFLPLAAGFAGVGLLGAIQSIPLPFALLALVSPNAAEIWSAAPLVPSPSPLSAAPYESAGQAVGWMAAAMLYVATAWWVAASRERTAAPVALVSVALLVGLAAAAERTTALSIWSPHLTWADQGMGPFPNRNDLALLTASAVPPACAGLVGAGLRLYRTVVEREAGWSAVVRGDPDTGRAIGWASALALLIAVTMSSGSRVAFAGMMVGIGVYGALQIRARRDGRTGSRWRRWALPASVMAVVLAISAWRGRLPDGTQLDGEMAVRLGLWKATLAMTADHPLFGVGLGAWASVLPRYPHGPDWGLPAHAENDALEHLAESGLFGTAMIAVALAFWARGLLRVPREHRLAAAGVGGGIAALLAGSLGTFAASVPALLLWFAALAGIGTGLAGGGEWRRDRARRLLLAAVASVALAPALAGRIVSGRVDAVAEPGRGALLRAARWNPNDPRNALALATSWEREAALSPVPFRDATGPLQEAIRWHGRRLSVRPGDAYSRLALAALLETAARAAGDGGAVRSRAEELRRTAAAVSPAEPAITRLAR